jgi:hypothetical protein
MSRKSLCKRNYRQAGNLAVEDRAEGVKTGIYTNAATFAAPPITQAAFAANILTYSNTRKAHEQGGTAQLPAFTAARKVLIGNLDKLASYVDEVALGDAQIVKLAGFEATNDITDIASKAINTAPATPQNITFRRVENNSGQMVAECELYGTGYRYISFLVENSSLPAGVLVDDNGNITIPAGVTVNIVINVSLQRKKLFKGLTPGSNYNVYYVVVNAKGASGISAGKAMMCG